MPNCDNSERHCSLMEADLRTRSPYEEEVLVRGVKCEKKMVKDDQLGLRMLRIFLYLLLQCTNCHVPWNGDDQKLRDALTFLAPCPGEFLISTYLPPISKS